jgi:hypothetical protein
MKGQPQVPSVPGVQGTTVIWPALQATEFPASFRKTGGASRWHTGQLFNWGNWCETYDADFESQF